MRILCWLKSITSRQPTSESFCKFSHWNELYLTRDIYLSFPRTFKEINTHISQSDPIFIWHQSRKCPIADIQILQSHINWDQRKVRLFTPITADRRRKLNSYINVHFYHFDYRCINRTTLSISFRTFSSNEYKLIVTFLLLFSSFLKYHLKCFVNPFVKTNILIQCLNLFQNLHFCRSLYAISKK